MAHFPSSMSLVLTNYLVSYTGCVLSLPFYRWRQEAQRACVHAVKGTRADTRGFESQLCCWVSLTCLLSLSPFVHKMRVEIPALQERMKWKGRWKVSGTSWAINAQAMIFVVIVSKVTCQGHRGKIEPTSLTTSRVLVPDTTCLWTTCPNWQGKILISLHVGLLLLSLQKTALLWIQRRHWSWLN